MLVAIGLAAFMYAIGWAAGWNARNRRDVPEFVTHLDDYRSRGWMA